MYFRSLTSVATVSIWLAIDLLVWALVSMFEGNVAIWVLHVAVVILGLVCVMAIERRTIGVFMVALLTRDLFAILGWYTTTDSNRKFFLGTNEDSARFWEAASLNYAEAIKSFEDPFFPRINSFLYQTAITFSEPSYLANTQAVLMAGVLMVLFATLLLDQLYGWKVAKLAGLIMALHPVMVAFSTGLIRDELIGMFGFLLLYVITRILTARGLGFRLWLLGLLMACGFALAFLRSISLAGFTVAGVLLLFAKTHYQNQTLSRQTKIYLCMLLAGLLAFAVVDRFDRFENIMDHAIKSRAQDGGLGTELNPNGITTKIAEASPFLFVLVSPLALLQPFPFYVWEPSNFLGGETAFMDVVLGFGGLTNQVLFGFYVIAISFWCRTRDTFGIWLGLIFTLFTGTMTLMGLGQIRMTMAHCYPFFIAGVSLAIVQVLECRWHRIKVASVICVGSLVFLYLTYLSYRELGSALLASLMFAVAMFGFLRLWGFGSNFRAAVAPAVGKHGGLG